MSTADKTDPVPLGPEDRAILALESPTIAGHTCKVVRLGGAPLDVDALRARIAERIALAPALTRRLGARRAGEPSWVPDTDFDVAHHVGPAPVEGAARPRRAARARRAAVRAAPGPRAPAVADRRGRARRRRQRARVADPPRARRRHRLGALRPRAALGPPARRGRRRPRRRPRSPTPPTSSAGVRISPASCAASTRAARSHSPFDGTDRHTPRGRLRGRRRCRLCTTPPRRSAARPSTTACWHRHGRAGALVCACATGISARSA